MQKPTAMLRIQLVGPNEIFAYEYAEYPGSITVVNSMPFSSLLSAQADPNAFLDAVEELASDIAKSDKYLDVEIAIDYELISKGVC